MSNEETIINGIIESNIKYFIDTFDLDDTPNTCFKEYFTDYIGGDLVDINEVYNNIYTQFEPKILDICEKYLDQEIYKQFICDFLEYLQHIHHNIHNYNKIIEICSILFINEQICEFIKSDSAIGMDTVP